MRHLGKQIFNKIESDDVKTFSNNVLDSLNIPLHKSINGNKFGDILVDADTLKMYDNYNNSRAIADLNNPDILKSLILSEIVFDDFLNFNKSPIDAISFNTDMTIGTDIVQYTIDEMCDMTIINDTTSVIILEIDNTDTSLLYSKMIVYVSNALPIRATFYDNTTYENTMMLYINSISYDNYSNKINLTLYQDNQILIDCTTYDITRLKLETFSYNNNYFEKKYIDMPYHYHDTTELSDLTSVTNTINGYTKLSNNILRLPQSNQTLFEGIKRLYGTPLYKECIDDIQYSKLLKLYIDKSNVISNATYITNEIDLGDSSIFEYYTTGLDISFNERLWVTTDTNYKAYRDYSTVLSDDTTYITKYLVEIVTFNYNTLVVGEDSTNIDSIVNIKYDWIDKTIIDADAYITYNNNFVDGTAIIYNGYYNINLIQPNINTIPTLLVQYNNIYKDMNGQSQLRIPKIYDNISTPIHLNIDNLVKIYLLFDTTSDATIDIYEFDIMLNIYTLSKSVDNSISIFNLDCGKYKFVTTNLSNNYKLIIFN